MARTFTLNEATWRRLADPAMPRAVKDWRGFHFEVDQTKQVLSRSRTATSRTWLHMSRTWLHVSRTWLHVSTGANGSTHGGIFRVFSELEGFSPHRL